MPVIDIKTHKPISELEHNPAVRPIRRVCVPAAYILALGPAALLSACAGILAYIYFGM